MKCEGLSVALASDGYEAVKNCENENFDLIILDVRMPKLDGLGACRKIREFSSTPIIFLSAYGEEKNFLDAYKSGGGNTQFITQKVLYIDGKAYSILLDVRYDLFFNTIGSNVFLKNFQVQSAIFITVEVIISIIAQRLLKKQKELNDARDAFTSAAAHELKTPITIINNQCECIIKKV